MRLDRLEIQDYKACMNTELEVDNNLTALIGINGSGKTTILSAINYLKDSMFQSRYYHENMDENNPITTITAVFSDELGKITLKACIRSGYNNVIEEEAVEMTTFWKIPEISVRRWIEIPIEILNKNVFFNADSYERSGRLYSKITAQKIKEIKKELGDSILERLFHIAYFIKSISYYSATQFSDPLKSPVSVEIEDRDRNNIYRYSKNRNLHSAFVIDLYKLKKNDESAFNSYINLIGKNGIGLINDIDFDEVKFKSEEVKVKAAGKIKTETRLKTVIVPKIYVDNNVLSFNQLSEGTLKTISLLFYIIRENSSLLLIEEPEVCVHHGLLASIIEVIKSISRDKQILVSTHSDLVLDKLAPENLVIITRNKDTGISAKKLSKTLSKNSYKALHEYLMESGNLGEYWREGGFDD